MTAAGRSSQSFLNWKSLLGYAIAAACLLWVFHDIDFHELFGSLKGIHWWWVLAAVFFDAFSYVCQGIRWSLLLHPVGRISSLRATEAIYAGLFVNEILPMRLGEVLRIYLVSRWAMVRFAAVIPSILVERFFDAIWLALAFGVTVLFAPLPKYLVNAEWALATIALAAAVLFIYLVAFRRGDKAGGPNGRPAGKRVFERISDLLSHMAGGIRDIGQSRYLYASFFISLLFLVGQIFSFWLVMPACGLNLTFWHGAAIFLIVHIGTAIPSAPSNLGTYQFFTVVGLTLFGVDKTLATGFSVVVFVILTAPLWAIGFFVFGRLGLSLKDIRMKISALGDEQTDSESRS